jgi:hypothetical protein
MVENSKQVENSESKKVESSEQVENSEKKQLRIPSKSDENSG